MAKDWLGPWEQRFWKGLIIGQDSWVWRRSFVSTKGIGFATVTPNGHYQENESYFLDATESRKEWMKRYGTPANMGTQTRDRVEPR